ncbi:hypothetical protein GW796_09560 [archaeon]|nr:hypothetical protein [archaeon]
MEKSTTQSYYEYLGSLPEELRNISLENWDITGRPNNSVVNPKGNVILAFLHKTASVGGKEFMADMSLLFQK